MVDKLTGMNFYPEKILFINIININKIHKERKLERITLLKQMINDKKYLEIAVECIAEKLVKAMDVVH